MCQFIKYFFLCAFLLGIINVTESTEQATAHDILKKANWALNYAGFGKTNEVEITILGNQKIESKFQQIRFYDKNGNTQSFQVFSNNLSDLSRLANLIWYNFGNVNNPTVKKSIATTEKLADHNNQLQIMNFPNRGNNEMKIHIDSNNHRIIDSGIDHYLIESISTNDKNDEYVYSRTWILDKIFIPVEVEFYNQDGLLIQLFEVHSIVYVQGHPTIAKILVDDLEHGERMEVIFSGVRYQKNSPVDLAKQSLFNSRLRPQHHFHSRNPIDLKP